MKKTVFVVEGQTEQIFILKFIEKLVVQANYSIQLFKFHDNQIIELSSRGANQDNATHLIQIINVENDNKVLSYISDNVESFLSKGFTAVFGLRDKFNNQVSVNVEKINDYIAKLKKQHNIEIDLTVAIEEVEAWFLASPSFFSGFDNDLGIEKINQILGYDLQSCNVELLSHPAEVINKVLNSVGLEYKKKLSQIHKITHHLDFDDLYYHQRENIKPLNQTIGHLEFALS